MSRNVPKIAEEGVFNLTGGALDGSRVRVVDPRKALLTFLVYRDPETGITPQHPLMQTLAVVRRETDCRDLALHGLDYEEVTEYLAQAAAAQRALAGAFGRRRQRGNAAAFVDFQRGGELDPHAEKRGASPCGSRPTVEPTGLHGAP